MPPGLSATTNKRVKGPGPQTLVLTPSGSLSFVHRIPILPGHPNGFIQGRPQRD